MSEQQVRSFAGEVRPGKEVLIKPEAMALAVKGQTWGVPDGAGTEYDGEFTGEVYQGNLVVKIKRKSERQPKKPKQN